MNASRRLARASPWSGNRWASQLFVHAADRWPAHLATSRSMAPAATQSDTPCGACREISRPRRGVCRRNAFGSGPTIPLVKSPGFGGPSRLRYTDLRAVDFAVVGCRRRTFGRECRWRARLWGQRCYRGSDGVSIETKAALSIRVQNVQMASAPQQPSKPESQRIIVQEVEQSVVVDGVDHPVRVLKSDRSFSFELQLDDRVAHAAGMLGTLAGLELVRLDDLRISG